MTTPPLADCGPRVPWAAPRASWPSFYRPGDTNLPVVGKLDDYRALASALAWNDQVCPVVLFCFASPRREQTACRALAAAREAPALRIATAAIDPRTTGAAGPVWLPLLTRTGHRVR